MALNEVVEFIGASVGVVIAAVAVVVTVVVFAALARLGTGARTAAEDD